MAMTLPAAFEDARRMRSSSASFIVHLSGDSTDLYLSTRPLELSGIPTVEAGVRSFSAITQGLDVVSLQEQKQSVRIVLSALWPHGASGGPGEQYGYADDCGALVGGTAIIYLYPGSHATSLSDCLEVFQGIIGQASVEHEGVTIDCDAVALVGHRYLPQVKATVADYPNIPPEHENVVLPIHYGERSDYHVGSTTNSLTRQDGLFVPLLIARDNVEYHYVVASHAMGDINSEDVYIYIPALDAWSLQVNNGVVTSDGGADAPPPLTYATMSLDRITSIWYSLLSPVQATPSSTATVDAAKAFNAINSNNEDDHCRVYASSSTYADIVFQWHQEGTHENSLVENSIAEITNVSGTYPYAILRCARWKVHGDLDSSHLDIWKGDAWDNFSSDFSWGDGAHIHYNASAGAYDWGGSNGTFWHLGSGPANGNGTPTSIRFRFGNTSASWTPDVTEVARIEEVLILIVHRWPRGFALDRHRRKASRRGAPPSDYYTTGPSGRRYDRAPSGRTLNPGETISAGSMDPVDRIGIPGSARVFDTWITASGRWGATHEYAQIRTAPLQIESILRDELGHTNIDTASFDAVVASKYGNSPSSGSPSCNWSLYPNSRVFSQTIIEGLCWEWGLVLFQTRDGQFKLFDYEDGLDTLDTIFPADLANGLPILETTDMGNAVNELTIMHTKTEWDDAFRFTEAVTDTAAQAKYPIRNDVTQCNYLREVRSPSSNTFADGRRHVDRLFDRLIGDAPTNPKTYPERILSRPHGFVKLPTIGVKYAHAELGDWIHLDADSFDPALKFFGQSWSGINLMVIGTEVRENMTILKTFNWVPLPIT
jgi:hypothetical protein